LNWINGTGKIGALVIAQKPVAFRSQLVENVVRSSNERSLILKIETRAVGNVRILDLSGQITLGSGTMVVRNTIKDLIENGLKDIVLNLANVDYIDSSGVGELVSTYTTVTNNGGHLRLLGLTKRTREVLTMTKLLTVFEIFEDEKAAVAGFR
jgi:anti-sigma B factor antagonist